MPNPTTTTEPTPDTTTTGYGPPQTDEERELHALLGGRFGVTTIAGAVYADLGGGVELWVYLHPDYPNGGPWVAGITTADGEGHDDLDDYITERTRENGATMAAAVSAALNALDGATTDAEPRIARFRAAITAAIDATREHNEAAP